MVYAIKYCGGCNPRYDRGELVNKLKKHFDSKIEFDTAKENTEYDGLIVIGGCTNCCPSYLHYNTKTEPILIWDQDNIEHIITKIEECIDKN